MPKLTPVARFEQSMTMMRGDAIGEEWPLGQITSLNLHNRSYVERFLPIARPGTKLARAYIRVSTDVQFREGGVPISLQKKRIIEYCKTQPLTLFTFYYDIGISGMEGYDGRAGLKMLNDEAVSNEAVVFSDIDRMSRVPDFVVTFDQNLMTRGLEVRYVSSPELMIGPERSEYLKIRGMVAFYERKGATDRSLMSIDALMEKGLWRERPHFGWKLDPNNRTGPHIPDPHKFQIVAFIRDQCKTNPKITQTMLVRALEKKFNPADFNILLWTNIRISAIIAYPPNNITHNDKERWTEDMQRRRSKKQAQSRAKREEKRQASLAAIEYAPKL